MFFQLLWTFAEEPSEPFRTAVAICAQVASILERLTNNSHLPTNTRCFWASCSTSNFVFGPVAQLHASIAPSISWKFSNEFGLFRVTCIHEHWSGRITDGLFAFRKFISWASEVASVISSVARGASIREPDRKWFNECTALQTRALAGMYGNLRTPWRCGFTEMEKLEFGVDSPPRGSLDEGW